MPEQRTPTTNLQQVLASVSDVLFPAELGERPIDIHSVSCDGDTPLHVSVWRTDLNAVALLIAAGANINACGDMGETPLHIAVRQEDTAIINALLDAGADPNIRCEFNDTAQERAIKRGRHLARLFERR
jgi:ankyrin repeat protein